MPVTYNSIVRKVLIVLYYYFAFFTLNLFFSVNQTVDFERSTHEAPVALSLAKRMNMYDGIYQYKKLQPLPPKNSNDDICGASPEFPKYFQQNKYSRSQYGEDYTLFKLLFSKAINKTFVELGAYDGLHWSNTRFFEYCLGWKGLLIEASPNIYPDLVKNRPYAHKMSFAPTCQDANAMLTFDNRAKPTSGIVSSTTDFKGVVTVPCGPISPVLNDILTKEYGRITLFSLDVEKSELAVLKTIDFTKVQVDVWIIESNCKYCGNDRNSSVVEVREFMKSNHYHLYKGVVHNSDLFIHRDSPYQLT